MRCEDVGWRCSVSLRRRSSYKRLQSAQAGIRRVVLTTARLERQERPLVLPSSCPCLLPPMRGPDSPETGGMTPTTSTYDMRLASSAVPFHWYSRVPYIRSVSDKLMQNTGRTLNSEGMNGKREEPSRIATLEVQHTPSPTAAVIRQRGEP